MTKSFRSCPDCGARVPVGAESCDLCGSPVPVAASVTAAGSAMLDNRACSACGTQNPAGAKFCAECGNRLAAMPRAPEDDGASGEESENARAPEPIGRQVTILVSGAVLIVLALFVVTLVSRQNTSTGEAMVWEAPPSAVSVLEQTEHRPLDDDLAARVDAMESEIQQARGEEWLQRQRELVHVLIENGRPDHAAVRQQEIAERTGMAVHWREAGDLYFEWMELADSADRLDIARLTVFAYDNVLAQEPDNHDVRANLAWALQYDSQNPMRAIDETNFILNAEPEHVQANFNRGYFLMRINRFDEAVTQMERVRELAGPGSPVGEQASFIIDIIRSEQQRMRSGT